MYLREVNKFLALVCILREENFNRQGVIDYNFICFRDAISEVFELRLKRQKLLENADQDDDELADDNGITMDCSNHENDVAVASRAAKIAWASDSSDLKPCVHSYRIFFSHFTCAQQETNYLTISTSHWNSIKQFCHYFFYQILCFSIYLFLFYFVISFV